jgi:3-phenylpropionate/trans-cinnamate dioxygenase ferredoxin subunit
VGNIERRDLRWLTLAEIEVCPLEELEPGTVRIVEAQPLLTVGVYNCGGELFALEDRCSHDDGPLCEGEFDCTERVVVCPRHGARFDITTGRALTLPAYIPVDTYPVRVRDDGVVVVDA